MKFKPIHVLIPALYMIARINIKTKYDDLIKIISNDHGNNHHLVKAIIKVESNFRTLAHNTKGEDSRGLGQINAPTAIALGVTDLDSLFKPEINIVVMNQLLTDLKKRYQTTQDIIAAYNAGKVRMTKKGYYRNTTYVLNVYSRFIAYSILDV